MRMVPHQLTMVEDGKVLITVQDALDPGKVHQVKVLSVDYEKWVKQGALIQDAFPYLSADDREILMTGLGPDSWSKVVPHDD